MSLFLLLLLSALMKGFTVSSVKSLKLYVFINNKAYTNLFCKSEALSGVCTLATVCPLCNVL